jgi:hypothetical protein
VLYLPTDISSTPPPPQAYGGRTVTHG